MILVSGWLGVRGWLLVYPCRTFEYRPCEYGGLTQKIIISTARNNIIPIQSLPSPFSDDYYPIYATNLIQSKSRVVGQLQESLEVGTYYAAQVAILAQVVVLAEVGRCDAAVAGGEVILRLLFEFLGLDRQRTHEEVAVTMQGEASCL